MPPLAAQETLVLDLLPDSCFHCCNHSITLDHEVICQDLHLCWSNLTLDEGCGVKLQASHD